MTTAEPIWPLGLPGWDDDWVAAGLRHGSGTRLVVTRRFGESPAARLSLPSLRGRPVQVECVFPRCLPPWTWTWDAGAGLLEVTAAGSGPGARILELTDQR